MGLQRQAFRQAQFAGQILFSAQAAVTLYQPTHLYTVVHHHTGADFGLGVLLVVYHDVGIDALDAAVAQIHLFGASNGIQSHALLIQLGSRRRIGRL